MFIKESMGASFIINTGQGIQGKTYRARQKYCNAITAFTAFVIVDETVKRIHDACPEAAVHRCSVKKVFLEISQTSGLQLC